MNYEQKYKEAIEKAKKELKTCGSIDCDSARQIFRLFPELKESEDEKIRKELIERFKWELKGAEEQDASGCSRQKDIAMFKRGLAWLEKQGEKKSAEWSEKDEKMLVSALWHVSNSVSNGSSTDCKCQITDWLKSLKSLKPQSHWKPSKEQMEAIRIAAEVGSANNSWAMEKLKELYEQLKNFES